MKASAAAMMMIVCGLVWGGFAGFLVFVIRKEKKRASADQEDV